MDLKNIPTAYRFVVASRLRAGRVSLYIEQADDRVGARGQADALKNDGKRTDEGRDRLCPRRQCTDRGKSSGMDSDKRVGSMDGTFVVRVCFSRHLVAPRGSRVGLSDRRRRLRVKF